MTEMTFIRDNKFAMTRDAKIAGNPECGTIQKNCPTWTSIEIWIVDLFFYAKSMLAFTHTNKLFSISWMSCLEYRNAGYALRAYNG